MSTRAQVIVVDPAGGKKNVLYREIDGYVEGFGEDLVRVCDQNANAPDLDSFTFKLLHGRIGLENDTSGEGATVDWVYTIEWNPKAVSISAREVDWSGDNTRPISARLKPNIDVRSRVAAYQEQVRRHDAIRQEVLQKCGPCPVCGSRVDLYVAPRCDLFYARCMDLRCVKRRQVEAGTADEIIRRWREVDGIAQDDGVNDLDRWMRKLRG